MLDENLTNNDGNNSTGVMNIEKTWSDNIERVLDNLRINCSQLSNYHKFKYQYCKSQVKWFRIPIIVLSGINTFASVGTQEHLDQRYISIISSCISLVCGIITGIEMFMKYQDKMEIELATHKEYYKISIDVYKMISIDRSLRKYTGKDFMDEKFNEYEKVKSRSRPEQPSELVYDLLADKDELIVYKRHDTKRHKRGWVNKIELPPPLHEKQSHHFFNDAVSYAMFRNPEKYMLREQSKKLENKSKITQKYIDNRWIEKKKHGQSSSSDSLTGSTLSIKNQETRSTSNNGQDDDSENHNSNGSINSDEECIPNETDGYFKRMSNALFKPNMSVWLSDEDEDQDQDQDQDHVIENV